MPISKEAIWAVISWDKNSEEMRDKYIKPAILEILQTGNGYTAEEIRNKLSDPDWCAIHTHAIALCKTKPWMVLSRALGRLTPILAKMANEKEIATIVLDSDGDDGADTVYYYMQAEQQ